MVTEKNSLHDMDTWMFFKWFFKAWVAVFIVAHTFDITMAIFDVGQHVINSAANDDTADFNTESEETNNEE
jgi:hypothetical protein